MTQDPVPPMWQIRAAYTDRTVRVYQAFSPEIADNAVAAGTFVPPFSRSRMTWVKPSFTWMMYRSRWGTDVGQERVLAIEISRAGFELALASACLSTYKPGVHADRAAWEKSLRESPVRIQWDPERGLKLQPLEWRAIQIGLGPRVVGKYCDEWITRIEDITGLVREVQTLVQRGDLDAARRALPEEKPYPLPGGIAARIGCTR